MAAGDERAALARHLEQQKLLGEQEADDVEQACTAAAVAVGWV